MADTNPTDGADPVVLALTAKERKFLRSVFAMVRGAIRDELAEYADELREPARLHREEAAYDKLLHALDGGHLLATADVRDVLGDLAHIIDDSNEYERVLAEHEALHDLLGQLKGGEGR